MVAVSIFYEWYGYLYDDLGHGVCRTKNSDRKCVHTTQSKHAIDITKLLSVV